MAHAARLAFPSERSPRSRPPKGVTAVFPRQLVGADTHRRQTGREYDGIVRALMFSAQAENCHQSVVTQVTEGCLGHVINLRRDRNVRRERPQRWRNDEYPRQEVQPYEVAWSIWRGRRRTRTTSSMEIRRPDPSMLSGGIPVLGAEGVRKMVSYVVNLGVSG
jgi:hypothetical protein